jgi:ABC-2 type transport system permease protein
MRKKPTKHPLYTVYTFAKINTRRFFRDKTALFFSIGFPVIFLLVFGSLNSGTANANFKVAIINNSNSGFAKQFVDTLDKASILKINKEITDQKSAENKMSRSELDAAIVLPKNFGAINPGKPYPTGQAEVIYTQNNQQSATALTSILSGQFKEINSKFVPQETPFTVTSKQLNENSLSAFDYAFAGLLGFSIIGIGIFGPINVFPELKKMGILRRLSTTPLKVWQYFMSTMAGQAIIGAVSLGIMFVVAFWIFHLKVVGSWLELIPFMLVSMIMILGIGLALGGWAKNERQVAPLANIVVFPMMFLSGTFFPRFLMPEWLQNISYFLPLTPVIDGIRLIAAEGKHYIDILPQIGLIGAWMIVIYLIAFKVFRWE